LVRDRSFNAQLLRALDEQEIPVQLVDTGDLIDYPEVREVLCYLEVLDDPCANIALTRILTSSRWSIGTRDLAILGKRARDLVRGPKQRELPLDQALQTQVESADSSAALSLLDAIYDLGNAPKYTYSEEALVRFAQLRAELDSLRANLALSVPDLILRIYRVTGLSVEAQISERKITGADHISAFIDLAGSFTSLDGGSSLAAFLRYLRDGALHENETKLDAPVVEEAVVLMTMHKAKGLEFPVVFLPGFTQGKFPSKKGDSFWPTSATELPPEVLQGEQFDWMRPLASLASPKGKDKDAFSDEYKKRRLIEERRLAYVAITRAKELLFVSGSWWGPTQQEAFGPNSFLLELHEQADEVLHWHEGPEEGQTNPGFADVESARWQVGAARPEVVASAELVKQARAGELKVDARLSPTEQAQIAQIENDVAALIELLHESYSDEIVVDLPRNLSASALLRLKDNADSFARELVRPMPKPPAPAATRGTMFHAWVEQFFDAPATLPIEDMNTFDEWAYRDEELPKLQENFRNGPFAHRVPLAIEQPFSLTINSRVVQGRIDGIFTEPAGGTHDYLIVDWKTGPSANPLQLEIYRHAFANTNNVAPERVRAAFYHVATNELTYLANPLDWDALVAQLEI
jgi:DNA helicase-2/ATP-dependent DNA helicase PcrA